MRTSSSEGSFVSALLSGALGLAGMLLLAVVLATDAARMGPGSIIAAFGLVVLALVLRVLPGRFSTILLAVAAFAVAVRYLAWRIEATLGFDGVAEGVLGIAFLLAEVFMVLLTALYAFRAAWPSPSRPSALPDRVEDWPTADVFLPAGDAPLDAVRDAALAAVGMDYPAGRFDVRIVTASDRADVAAFADAAGIGLVLTESQNAIGEALADSSADLIAVFQPDCPPTRAFLQMTAGKFLAQSRLGFLQTPFDAYPAGPLETPADYPVGAFDPNAAGDALWNATRLESGAWVIRRAALEQVGGFADEPLDAFGATGLRLSHAGWGTAYLPIPLSAGPAAHRAPSLWGAMAARVRSTMALMRSRPLTRPLFPEARPALGLKLNGLARVMDGLRGLPWLALAVAPAAYLLFGLEIIQTDGLSLAIYGAPYAAFALAASSRLRPGGFWRKRVEDAGAVQNIGIAIQGAFGVAGEAADKRRGPVLALVAFMVLAAVSLLVGLARVIAPEIVSALPGTPLNGLTPVFVVWAAVAFGILLATLAAVLKPALAAATRPRASAIPATLVFADGVRMDRVASVINMTAAGFSGDSGLGGRAGERATATFHVGGEAIAVVAEIEHGPDGQFLARFVGDDLASRAKRVRLCFGRADAWLDAGRIAQDGGIYGSEGKRGMSIGLRRHRKRAAAVLFALAVVASIAAAPGISKAAGHAPSENGATIAPLTAFTAARSLDLAAPRGVTTLNVRLPTDREVASAKLMLRVLPMDADLGPDARLAVYLNDTQIGVEALAALESGATLGFDIAGDLLRPTNQLRFEATLGDAGACSVAGLRIDVAASHLQAVLRPKALDDDLALLPRPFVDPDQFGQRRLRFVMPDGPSDVMLEAAAVVASYLGAAAGGAGVAIDVETALEGPGDVVVFAAGDRLPGSVVGLDTSAARIYVRPNPVGRPTDKALVLTGPDDAGLLNAARWLALAGPAGGLQSPVVDVTSAPALEQRRVDDASRWARLDRPINLGELVDDPGSLQGLGALGQLGLTYRTPPRDFQNADKGPVLRLALDYPREDVDPGKAGLDVLINGAYGRTLKFAGSATADNGDAQSQTALRLDLGVLAGYENQLGFAYRVAPGGPDCAVSSLGPRFRIQPTSTLDFRDADPGVSLPELAHFAAAVYPFTRMADFGETVAVLPAGASSRDIAAFLTVMARAGHATGDAALKIRVARPDGVAAHPDRDVLAIGDWDGLSPMLSGWGRAGPFQFDGKGMNVATPSAIARVSAYLSGAADPKDATAAAWMSLDGQGFRGAASFARPDAQGRTVVLLAGRAEFDAYALAAKLNDPGAVTAFRGDFVRWTPGDGFKGHRLAAPYQIGPSTGWRPILAKYAGGPLAQIALLTAAIALLAAALFVLLRRISAARAEDVANF